MRFEITGFRRMPGSGGLKALIDICFDGMMTVRGFEVCRNQYDPGVRVRAPRQMGRNGNWSDRVTFREVGLQESISKAILERYQISLLNDRED